MKTCEMYQAKDLLSDPNGNLFCKLFVDRTTDSNHGDTNTSYDIILMSRDTVGT